MVLISIFFLYYSSGFFLSLQLACCNQGKNDCCDSLLCCHMGF